MTEEQSRDFFDRFGFQHDVFAQPDLCDISLERVYRAFEARIIDKLLREYSVIPKWTEEEAEKFKAMMVRE